MNDADTNSTNETESLLDMFNRWRGTEIIVDFYWLKKYSANEIIDAVDEIALGELGKLVIRNAARYAYGESCRRSSDSWNRIVPDELMEKLEKDLKRTYEQFQQAKLQKAQIDRVESLTSRANVIPFPKKERLQRVRMKKENTA